MARRCLAKAIYDNVAETPNELAFRKGDVLAVISQNVPSLDGWWLCSFRGKQGIAPGNRLQLLAGMYPAEEGDIVGDFQADSAHSSMMADYDVPRALGRQEMPAPVTPATASASRSPSDDQMSGPEALYDALPPTRGIPAGTTTIVSPFKSQPGKLPSNQKTTKDSLGPAAAAAADVQQQLGKQQQTAIRDLTYDVPLSLQHPGVGNGSAFEDNAAAKKDAFSRVAATRELEYDIPAALARMRATASNSVTPVNKEPSPPSPDRLYDVPLPQQQRQLAGSTRTSGFSLASSSTASWSSSGCGAEGSISPGTTSATASARSSLELLDIYDVPRSVAATAADGWSQQRRSGGSPATVTDELYDVLPGGAARPVSGGTGSAGTVRSSRNDSKGRVGHMKASSAAVVNDDVVYDVPPQVVRDSGSGAVQPPSQKLQQPSPAAGRAANEQQLQLQRTEDDQCSASTAAAVAGAASEDGLPLQLDSAVELLVKLQQDAATAVSRLLGLAANESWRRRHNLDVVMYDVKMACIGVQTNLQEFVEFARGACANVAKRTAAAAAGNNGGDRALLLSHLAAQLAPVEDKLQLINKSVKALSSGAKWQVSKLAVDVPAGGTRGDDLDTIVSCSQDGLADSVNRLATLIKSNASLIFRKQDSSGKAVTAVAAQEQPVGRAWDASSTASAWRSGILGGGVVAAARGSSGLASQHQEYDYIELDACDDRSPLHAPPSVPAAAGLQITVYQQQAGDVPSSLPSNKILSSAERPYSNGFGSTGVSGDDRQFLSYYHFAIGTIVDSVGDANGRLLAAIRQFETPQRLVALSKDVVMQAHRLVYIGETLGRSLAHAGTRTDIANAANELCNCLKNIIVSTKDILVVDQSQSNKALQVMVNRTNDVQRAVSQFKVAVTRPIST